MRSSLLIEVYPQKSASTTVYITTTECIPWIASNFLKSPSYLLHWFRAKMVASSIVKLCALLSVVRSALACLGYEGGLPSATSTKTNSAVIVVAAGTTFDGGWAKYDRGSGACNDQVEGGLSS